MRGDIVLQTLWLYMKETEGMKMTPLVLSFVECITYIGGTQFLSV